MKMKAHVTTYLWVVALLLGMGWLDTAKAQAEVINEPSPSIEAVLKRLEAVHVQHRAFHAELSDIKQSILSLGSLGGTSEANAAELTLRRMLLSTQSAADSFQHVSSDGSARLSISSDTGVDVESVQFSGASIGISADTDLLSLGSGTLTVNGDITATGSCCGSSSTAFTPRGFYVKKDSSTYITTSAGTWETVAGFTTTNLVGGWDSGNLVMNTGVFTAPVAGYYYVSAAQRINNHDPSGGSYFRLIISINDSNDYNLGVGGHNIVGNGWSSDYETIQVTNIISLSASDTIRFKVGGSTDGTYQIDAESHYSVFLMPT